MSDSAPGLLATPSADGRTPYVSETSRYRSVLLPHCQGYGIDIGFGGDPVAESAIRVDLAQPYAFTGYASVQLGGDARELPWFRDDVLDYVYSSHVLEDFPREETVGILREWLRPLRPGGHLVLLQPDQVRYVRHCERQQVPASPHHRVEDFSLEYLLAAARALPQCEPAATYPELGEYSFAVVFRKVSATGGEAGRIEILRDQLRLARGEVQTIEDHVARLERFWLLRLYRALVAPLKSLLGRGGAR